MYKFFTFLFIFCAWIGIANANAVLSLVQNVSPVENQEVRVVLELDTNKNIINGFDTSISYDSEFLQFVGYSSENSITTLWVNPPKASSSEINFSGIIPGGASVTYDPTNTRSEGLKLVELIFKAKQNGATELEVKKSDIFLNDGLGTRLVHQFKNIKLNIENIDIDDPNKNVDVTPPKNLTISLIPKSKEANTPTLISFEATDESGIASYKIRKNGNWQDVTSPYPVKQKVFSHKERVRAYDIYGNVAEAEVSIPSILPTYIILIFFGVFLAGFYIYKLLK